MRRILKSLVGTSWGQQKETPYFLSGPCQIHQEKWGTRQNNKLRRIRDSTRTWKSSYQENRMWELKLCRLRIGHTVCTHEWILKQYDQPHCTECAVPLTVYHIITECREFRIERRRIFGREILNIRNFKDILGDNTSTCFNGDIYKFLNEIQYYRRI